MASASDLASIKERADRLRRDSAKAEGALEKLQEQLREEFKCDTLEEAEKLLSKLRLQEEEADQSFRSASRKFDERWEKRLA